MARRHWFGAAASLVAGGVVAAAALVTSSGTSATSGSASALVKPIALPSSQSSQRQDQAALTRWRTTPVEQLFPATLTDGGQYVRLGIADAATCDVLPMEFKTELHKDAPDTSCVKVLRATYTDITQTVFATVGIVVLDGTAEARDKVWRQWTPDADSRRPELMPSVVTVPGTPAAGFVDAKRTTWNSQACADGSYLVYVVTAFADGRAGSTDAQLRAASGKEFGADSPPVQAALGLSQKFATQFDEARAKQ